MSLHQCVAHFESADRSAARRLHAAGAGPAPWWPIVEWARVWKACSPARESCRPDEYPPGAAAELSRLPRQYLAAPGWVLVRTRRAVSLGSESAAAPFAPPTNLNGREGKSGPPAAAGQGLSRQRERQARWRPRRPRQPVSTALPG